MSNLILRNTKGSALTFNEVDNNFSNLRSLATSFVYTDIFTVNHVSQSVNTLEGIGTNYQPIRDSGSGAYILDNIITYGVTWFNNGYVGTFNSASLVHRVSPIHSGSLNTTGLVFDSITVETNILSSSLAYDGLISQQGSFVYVQAKLCFKNAPNSALQATNEWNQYFAPYTVVTAGAAPPNIGAYPAAGAVNIGDAGTIKFDLYASYPSNNHIFIPRQEGWFYLINIPTAWPTGQYKFKFTAILK